LKVKNKQSVVFRSCLASAVAMLVTLLHIHVNYSPEVREIVRVKALIATFVISMGLTLWLFEQARRNYLLTVELKRLVNRDRLTDIATRDFFFERMSRRQASNGVSLMVDIDHFKSINDRFGHLVGDEVIQRVAGMIRELVRESDIVCRFGGEEFVVFLSGHNRDEGLAAAERIRQAISDLVIDVNGMPISVTVSIGASIKDSASDVMRSIQQADAALYKAKHAGRNQTRFAA
jgi:diguanylate cyclase (GGDEF)-like protein